MTLKTLKSTDAVIAALGGANSLAEAFGVGRSAVSNWRGSGRFPAHTYPAIINKLSERGLSAEMSLWNFGRRERGTQAPAEAAQ